MKGIIGAATVVGCLQEAFRLSATVKTGEFPPAALVELYHEPARLRRLHLVIVDLLHPRKTATWTEKHFYKQITGLWNNREDSVTPIPLCNQEDWRCPNVFGYNLDDSDKPLSWYGQKGLEIMASGSSIRPEILCQSTSIRNLGLEHFYAAFGWRAHGTSGPPLPEPLALV